MTHCVVVDTNVMAVAEGMNAEASADCVYACIALLTKITEGKRVAVDEGGEILAEYTRVLRRAATPGIATKLAKALVSQQFNDSICHRVSITPTEDPAGSYEEVPASLSNFDNDDQKFIAVALATTCGPPVYQALDREWWDRHADLVAGGLGVQFLCSTDLL
jgi:hypothetical protein